MVLSRAIGLASDLASDLNCTPRKARLRMRFRNALLAVSLVVTGAYVAVNTSSVVYAQSAVTGAVSGTVTDGSGAVIPGAQVIVTDTGTDAKQTVVTNAEGRYTVGLLKPGNYKITATSTGLKSDTVEIAVVLGTTVPGDIKVTPTGDTTIVDVNATNVPLLDTQNVALSTTFTEEQIQELPTPGGDVTTIAFTAPGVVVNAGGSYGNFSSNGLPGISNLFVLNGFDNQDPFLNLNNSGSSNLTLGQGEEAEVTVVQNGYNSQFGRAAGAIIQYTTKSGSNQFHGMADYNYNGTVLNSNGWFNQYDGQPRPHAVSNQWAANVGGPILKDRLFFFADYEGLRYVLPGSSGAVTMPSPQLQTYALANVPAAAQSFYQQTFGVFDASSVYKSAQPVTTGTGPGQDSTGNLGCGAGNGPFTSLLGTPTGTGGTFGVDTPCLVAGFGSANNINKEWLFTGRIDWHVSDKHNIYGRVKADRGSQPTYTNFINPIFNAVSIQPEDEGQFNDSYVFTPQLTNVFVAAANWYSAYFGPANNAASQAVYPWFGILDAGVDGSGVNSASGMSLLGVPDNLTQGRNVTQYQLEDDLNWIKGKHTFKVGFNFRRDLVSDYDSQIETIFPEFLLYDLPDFASGNITSSSEGYGGDQYDQAYTATKTAHLALYNIGVYAQDDWQARSNLKLTIGVRFDRTGNPVCHDACFSQYRGSFPSSNAGLTGAYSGAAGGPIYAANTNPFPSTQLANFQPRFGFNYAPTTKTEVRGGVGIFSDLYPAVFLDGVVQNFPNYFAPEVISGIIAPSGAGSVAANSAAANAAVQSGFAAGQGVQQINTTLSNAGVPFTPPSLGAYFNGKFKVPEYLEYSLQIQRQLTKSDAILVSYVGNYGYDEVIINPYQNAGGGQFNNATGSWGVFNSSTGAFNPAGTPGFAGLNATPADPRFTRVSAFTNNAHSNYNGAWVSWKHNGHGATGQLSYTYGHSLDIISNGGEGLGFNAGAVSNQLTPSLGYGNLNYSNSDYDIRHNIVGDVVYDEPFKFNNLIANNLLGGWSIGAKTYWRTGEPFSINNSSLLASYPNLGTTLMPQLAPGVSKLTNTSTKNPHAAVLNSALDITQYQGYGTSAAASVAQNSFGNIRRNVLYGPHYVDTDISLTKTVVKLERMKLVIGANAYNIFNNVNFAQPVTTLTASNFGEINSTNAPPTSPYGSFQGAAVTQRVLQIHGNFTF